MGPVALSRDVRAGAGRLRAASGPTGGRARRRDTSHGGRDGGPRLHGRVCGRRRRAPDRGPRWSRGSPAPPTRRGRRSHVDRRLPGARGLRGAPGGPRDGTGGSDRRGDRREAPRTRRGSVPHRGEVEGRRRAARPDALRDLQRRRVRAGHLQGSGRDGTGSLRRRGGAHDRGVRLRGGARLRLRPRGVSVGDRAPRARDRGGTAPRLPRRGRHGRRHGVRHRAPPWRRGVHLRRGDRPVQLDRGQARGAAEQAPVPGDPRRVRQADRDQQRGDADQRPRGAPDRLRGVRGDRDGRLDGTPPVLPLGAGRAARASTRSSTGPPSAT